MCRVGRWQQSEKTIYRPNVTQTTCELEYWNRCVLCRLVSGVSKERERELNCPTQPRQSLQVQDVLSPRSALQLEAQLRAAGYSRAYQLKPLYRLGVSHHLVCAVKKCSFVVRFEMDRSDSNQWVCTQITSGHSCSPERHHPSPELSKRLNHFIVSLNLFFFIMAQNHSFRRNQIWSSLMVSLDRLTGTEGTERLGNGNL